MARLCREAGPAEFHSPLSRWPPGAREKDQSAVGRRKSRTSGGTATAQSTLRGIPARRMKLLPRLVLFGRRQIDAAALGKLGQLLVGRLFLVERLASARLRNRSGRAPSPMPPACRSASSRNARRPVPPRSSAASSTCLSSTSPAISSASLRMPSIAGQLTPFASTPCMLEHLLEPLETGPRSRADASRSPLAVRGLVAFSIIVGRFFTICFSA